MSEKLAELKMQYLTSNKRAKFITTLLVFKTFGAASVSTASLFKLITRLLRKTIWRNAKTIFVTTGKEK